MKLPLLLLLLAACSAQVEPAIAPPAQIVFSPCQPAKAIGEACLQTCECLRPSICLHNICSLTRLKDGELCASNKQCISGYCMQSGRCGGPDGPKANYDCERVCRDDYAGRETKCHTACRYR